MNKEFKMFSKVGLLILSVFLMISSCTKEEYYENPVEWDVFNETINSSSWSWENGGYYALYYADIATPELTSVKVQDGGLQVARNIGNNVFKPLPYTEYLYDDAIGYYSQTVDYEYEAGYIRIYVKQSDLYDKTPTTFVPSSMNFKVTIFY